MRGVLKDGYDCRMTIGKEDIYDQTKKQKKEEYDNKKKILKKLYTWCDHLHFEKREIVEI